MLNIFKRTDIYFDADDAHRFLPWLIGIMVCLATFLLCLGLSINGWVMDRHSDYAGSFTVNIPAQTEDISRKSQAIREALQKMPGVTGVSEVGEEKLKSLLGDWLGTSDSLADLPVPTVLDVAISAKNPGEFDYKSVEKNLAAIAPGIEIDAHEQWVAAFANFSAAARSLMLMLAALIVLSMTVMIVFSSRASLKLHAKTVHLLHSVGAEDHYISRQFQQDICRMVLPGTCFGVAFAALAYYGIGAYLRSLGTAIQFSLSFDAPHLILLFVMPIACVAAAWVVTYISVAHQLRRVL